MRAKLFGKRTRFLLPILFCALLIAGTQSLSPNVHSQTNQLILISEETSTRAVAVNSVTQQHEPFSAASPIQWGSDSRTRIMVFAMGLSLQPGEGPLAVTADAEDGAHNIHRLTVEYVGPVPEQEWVSSIILRLDDQMEDPGDVLIGISYHGSQSNRVRVGIGHVGDGARDDAGAVPKPGMTAPPPSPPITAGTLNASDVQTIIAQAVSTAAQLNRPVTVAVTDREGNVLGVFKMTGAPASTQLRGGGPGPSQVPSPLTGFVPVGLDGTVVPAKLAAISKAGTASLFSTRGNAFTSRTAGFIIQEHFPPGVDFRSGGPLYGVQFSCLPCSDIKVPGLPLGLRGDPGSVPIYKNREAVWC